VKRLSLRARLLLGVLALALIGVGTADAFTYTQLRSFLLTRVDRTLDEDHTGAERLGGGHDSFDGFDHGGGGGIPGVYVQIRSADGTRVLRTYGAGHFPGTTTPAAPSLPATITVPAAANDGPDRVARLTVPARDGHGRYRVRASLDPSSTSMLVIATSLAEVDGTLHHLMLIELFVTLAVLLGIGMIGLWIVRLGLRPLVEIGRTADRIAGGDLSHRVEVADARTEVGRLGLAFNAMLDRIETSDRRLRRFVADASHELLTPLAAVRAYAELFQRGAATRPDDLARSMSGITRERDSSVR